MTPARDTQAKGAKGGSGGRLAAAGLVGLLVGFAVAWSIGSVFDGVPLGGWWGSIHGGLALPAAFGVTLLVGSDRRWHRRMGSFVLALAAGLYSLGVWSLISLLQVPFDRLEGNWIWPLAIVSTANHPAGRAGRAPTTTRSVTASRQVARNR